MVSLDVRESGIEDPFIFLLCTASLDMNEEMRHFLETGVESLHANMHSSNKFEGTVLALVSMILLVGLSRIRG